MTQRTNRSAAATPLPSPRERRRLRMAKALSQQQVATAVGVTWATVWAWETGRTNPRGRRREAYANLLTHIAAEEAEEAKTAGPAPRTEPAPQTQAHAHAHKPAAPSRTKQSGASTRPKPAVKRTDKPPITLPTTAPVPAKSRPMAPTHATRSGPPDPSTTAPTADQHVALTPDEAFDALYAYAAPDLVRQTYLLTGRRRLSPESVERAFHLAWQRWPEVAADPDPVGWVRAAAYEYALSPWHRLRRAHRQPDSPAMEPSRRALFNALLELPPSYRRALLLYDGLGLDLPEIAAETEASTPATANRVLHARAAIAERLPELGEIEVLHERLTALANAQPAWHLTPAHLIRRGSERRARFWTRAAIAVTTLIIGATLFTLVSAPMRYEPPLAPGEQVGGVPPRSGPPRLSPKDKELRKKLLSEPAPGPERLVPQVR
jgi:DNA-directed RNA polymerase specialized sigma24 family protein/DNA-binding transcriptional regulator YiaG